MTETCLGFFPSLWEGLGEGAKRDTDKPSPRPSPKGRGRKNCRFHCQSFSLPAFIWLTMRLTSGGIDLPLASFKAGVF
jgi:hypothetical protein